MTKALNGLSCSVMKGEFLGSSGSGKTTLLNCIGIMPCPTKGQLLLNGGNIAHFSAKQLEQLAAYLEITDVLNHCPAHMPG